VNSGLEAVVLKHDAVMITSVNTLLANELNADVILQLITMVDKIVALGNDRRKKKRHNHSSIQS
jgi:hypothetical protein